MATTVAVSARDDALSKAEARRTRARAAATAKRFAAAVADIPSGTLSPGGLTLEALVAYMNTLEPAKRHEAGARLVRFKLEEQESKMRSERARMAHARKAQQA